MFTTDKVISRNELFKSNKRTRKILQLLWMVSPEAKDAFSFLKCSLMPNIFQYALN